MEENKARHKFRQIVSAVEYCHARSVIHRDLKAENLLLDIDMNIKIADFGFSNTFEAGHKLDTFCGSPPYAAPELFQGKKYDGPEVDVWSLGVILYTLVSGSLPFDGSNLKELRERVLRGKYRIPFYMSSECEQLLKRFMVLVPAKRVSLRKCMDEQWMNLAMEPLVPHENTVEDYTDEDRLKRMETWGFSRSKVLVSLEANECNHETGMYYLLGNAELPPLEMGSSSTDDGVAFSGRSTEPKAKTSPRRRSVAGGAHDQTFAEQAPPALLHRTNTVGGNITRPKEAMVQSKLQRRHTEQPHQTDPVAHSADRGSTPPSGNGVPIAMLRGREGQTKAAPEQQHQQLRSRTRRETEPADPQHAARSSPLLLSTSPTKSRGMMHSLKRRFSRSVIEKNASSASFSATKPRSLRFTFSMSSTSDRPADDIMAEIRHVLTTNKIEFQQQDSYLVVCRAESVHFEIEVCKLPRLNMHGVRHKRIGGTFSYSDHSRCPLFAFLCGVGCFRPI